MRSLDCLGWYTKTLNANVNVNINVPGGPHGPGVSINVNVHVYVYMPLWAWAEVRRTKSDLGYAGVSSSIFLAVTKRERPKAPK